jgi:hypothetical protein
VTNLDLKAINCGPRITRLLLALPARLESLRLSTYSDLYDFLHYGFHDEVPLTDNPHDTRQLLQQALAPYQASLARLDLGGWRPVWDVSGRALQLRYLDFRGFTALRDLTLDRLFTGRDTVLISHILAPHLEVFTWSWKWFGDSRRSDGLSEYDEKELFGPGDAAWLEALAAAAERMGVPLRRIRVRLDPSAMAMYIMVRESEDTPTADDLDSVRYPGDLLEAVGAAVGPSGPQIEWIQLPGQGWVGEYTYCLGNGWFDGQIKMFREARQQQP